MNARPSFHDTTSERELPHEIEIEAGILGSILINTRAI